MNRIEPPQPDTDAAVQTAWATEVAEYLSGADNKLARDLDDRPTSRATASDN